MNEARGLKIKNSFRVGSNSVRRADEKRIGQTARLLFLLFLHKSRMHDGRNVWAQQNIRQSREDTQRANGRIWKCLCVLIYGIYCIYGHINIFMERFLFDRLFRDYSSMPSTNQPFHHNHNVFKLTVNKVHQLFSPLSVLYSVAHNFARERIRMDGWPGGQ